MNEKLIQEALNLAIRLNNEHWGYSSDLAIFTEALASLDAENVEYCEWRLTDREVADHPVYETGCGNESIRPNKKTCRCGKPIRIKEQ